MTIPPEVLKQQGWTEGTAVKISIGDQGSVIIEEVKEPNEDQSQSASKDDS
jgi:antitoxin component of MazEF toxin-antitoxin module